MGGENRGGGGGAKNSMQNDAKTALPSVISVRCVFVVIFITRFPVYVVFFCTSLYKYGSGAVFDLFFAHLVRFGTVV